MSNLQPSTEEGVDLEKRYCFLCDVKLPSDVNTHLLGKKHTKKSAFWKITKEKARKTVVIHAPDVKQGTVKWYTLKSYFKRFGPVKQVDIIPNSAGSLEAAVTFEDPECAGFTIAKTTHNIGGHEFFVKAAEIPPITQGKETAKTYEINYDSLFEKMKKINDVEAQMHFLFEEIQLSSKSCAQRANLCKAITDTINKKIPGGHCRVEQFGSSANGFGVEGCDLDLILIAEADKHNSQAKAHCSSLHGNKRLSMGEFLEKEPLCQVKMLRNILNFVPGIKSTFLIKSNRCPIVKFVYEPGPLHCDLGVSNRLSLENTKLLRFYSVLDQRVKPLAYTVKTWAKLKGITGGVVNSGGCLSNYSLILMVIFYLQNNGVLPTVETLASMCDPTEIVTVEDWDCSFCSNLARIPQASDAFTLVQLLQGFFKFYKDFDFDTQIICPRNGQTLKKTASGLEIMKRYLAVQDPFDLHHNPAHVINFHTFQTLKQELHKGADMDLQNLVDLFTKKLSSPKKSQKPVDNIRNPPPEPRTTMMQTSKPSSTLSSSTANDCCTEATDTKTNRMKRPITDVHSEQDASAQFTIYNSNTSLTEEDKESWVSEACHSIQAILRDVLCFDVQVLGSRMSDVKKEGAILGTTSTDTRVSEKCNDLDDKKDCGQPAKKMKVSTDTSSVDSPKTGTGSTSKIPLVQFQLTMNHPTWKLAKRNKARHQLFDAAGFLDTYFDKEKETFVSQAIIQQSLGNETSNEPEVCVMKIHRKRTTLGHVGLTVVMHSKQFSTGQFNGFSTFMKGYLVRNIM